MYSVLSKNDELKNNKTQSKKLIHLAFSVRAEWKTFDFELYYKVLIVNYKY